MDLTAEQLALIERTHLDYGAHDKFDDGACAMELVSYIAGEPWGDHLIDDIIAAAVLGGLIWALLVIGGVE